MQDLDDQLDFLGKLMKALVKSKPEKPQLDDNQKDWYSYAAKLNEDSVLHSQVLHSQLVTSTLLLEFKINFPKFAWLEYVYFKTESEKYNIK